MSTAEWIDILTLAVLILFAIALVYLILILYRANKLVNRLDHFGNNFRSFMSDVVPAVISIGTIVSSLHAILKTLHGQSGTASKHSKSTKK